MLKLCGLSNLNGPWLYGRCEDSEHHIGLIVSLYYAHKGNTFHLNIEHCRSLFPETYEESDFFNLKESGATFNLKDMSIDELLVFVKSLADTYGLVDAMLKSRLYSLFAFDRNGLTETSKDLIQSLVDGVLKSQVQNA